MTDEEISKKVANFVRELAEGGQDQEDKTSIVFSIAVNSVMMMITVAKLFTGSSTKECRENVISAINEQISRVDHEGDEIITWREEGEARA